MRLPHIKALQKQGRAFGIRAKNLLDRYAHITYAARVAVALGIGVFGVGTVYAFAGAENLGALRSALLAAVSGSVVIQENPIVLSGISVEGEVVSARELALSVHTGGVIEETLRVGDSVDADGVILRLDDTDMRRLVRSAEISLAAARLSARLNASAAVSALSLDSATRNEASAQLGIALIEGHQEITGILPLLPDVVSGLSGMLYGGGGFGDESDYLMAHAGTIEADNEAISPLIARAGDEYIKAKRAYESAFALFHREPNPSDSERERLIITTHEMLQTLGNAFDATEELFSFIKKHRGSFGYAAPSVFEIYEESLANYSAQVRDQESIVGGTRSLVEAARAVLSGEASIEVSSPESAALEIQRAELALEEAQARLAYYELHAPFAGTIARLDKRAAQYVDDGETVALLVASEENVHITLMQGEAARVNVGTRVLVSVEGTDISVPGVVKEMDAVGKKDEDGIVVFEATISFPKPDDRLKPGMQVIVGFEMGSAE